MLNIIRLFFRSKDANSHFVVFCILMSSLAEAVGIGTLLPIISIAASDGAGGDSPLGSFMNRLFGWMGFTPSLGVLVLIVTVFMVLKAVLTYTAMSYATLAAARVSLSLRTRLAAAMLMARWSYFTERRSGNIANLIGREAAQAGEAYINAASVVAAAIQTVAYAIIAVAISPVLAAFAVITGVAMSFLLHHYVRVARRAGFQQTDRMSMLLNYTVDLLANIKPLMSMHRQLPMQEMINGAARKLQQSFVKRELSKAGLARGAESFRTIIAALGIYVGSAFLKVPFAELLVSAIVFSQIMAVVSKLQRLVQIAVALESSYVRVLEAIEDAEAEREVDVGTVKPEAGDLSCRFENVSFAHGSKPVLDSVNLVIPARSITVLSGPSGAGKTTIIDLFIGLQKVNSGRIMLGEHPIEKVDLASWRSQIGYVPQELTLFHDTIRNNLTLGNPDITDADVFAALDQAGATGFMADMPQGLDTEVGEMGAKLSGGQRQRISLARALVVKPKILVLDEVTSALDPRTESGIVDNIARLRGRYTIVAITHRPAWTRIADQLYNVEALQVTRVEPGRAASPLY